MSKSYRNTNQDNNSSSAKNNRGKAKFRGKNSRQGHESLLNLEDDSLQEMFASRFDCND